MSSLDVAFQTLLQSQISAALPAVSVGSHPLPDGDFPYLYHGESEVTDDYVEGHMVLATIHTYSKLAGPDEIKSMQNSVRGALHSNTFSESNWIFSCIREEYASSQIDPDKETWHGIQRFKALAQVSA